MEDLSGIDARQRVTISLPRQAYLKDHRFLGKSVLPAVESMELLASAVRSVYPEIPCTDIHTIDLKRFLELQPGAEVQCFADIFRRDDGSVAATLSSSRRTGARAIARTLNHASAVFSRGDAVPPSPPMDVLVGLAGICRRVEGPVLYGEMVPFGSSYHNAELVFISGDGAVAFLKGGPGEQGERLLGSPFTLDAAFHAACAWGQSLHQFVGFPVAMERRIVITPTVPGLSYFARIMPVSAGIGFFTCDIWIHGMDGAPHEAALGLTMRDISAGKLAPSPWIGAPDAAGRFGEMSRRCSGVMVLELEAMPDFASCAFSALERARYETMGAKRRRSYAGSRIACKRLARVLSGDDPSIDPRSIETVTEGTDAPRLGTLRGSDPAPCSVSHDSRFVFCAAARGSVGVDVEAATERLLTTKRFYANEGEQRLASSSELGEGQGLLRIWTIKESAAKALGVPLSEAWKRTSVTEIGTSRSKISIDGTDRIALHETVDDHLFTLIIL